MEVLPLKKSIERVSYDILKASKSLDMFPTPVDRIVAHAELVVRNDVDISKIHNGYLSLDSPALRRAIAKVRGLLDRRERYIYLDLSQVPSRKNFVKLHETGHHVLPWQRGIYEWLDDDDDSLRPEAIEEFEAEANYFASLTLFQHDRFDTELDKLALEMESAIYLSKKFGASIHSTLRKMVESSPKRCALIVLKNFAPKGEGRSCDLRDLFQSRRFGKAFGEMLIPRSFDSEWTFVNDYYYGRRLKKDGRIALPTAEGFTQCSYEFFHNYYNAFVLVLPKGEPNKSRTKFYVNDR
jgi:hypothetical protein